MANFIVVVGQELTSEIQDLVADIVGRFLVIVAELRMPIALARLPVQIGIILADEAIAGRTGHFAQLRGHGADSGSAFSCAAYPGQLELGNMRAYASFV